MSHVHSQRLCAHSGDEVSGGNCECDGCVCPKGSVAFDRMCLYNVSDNYYGVICACAIHVYVWTE